MSTWDQIRSEVRSFRASVQPTVTTIRDFTFDSRRGRIYFLANDLAKSSKSPMLFYVDLPHVFTESDNEMDQDDTTATATGTDADFGGVSCADTDDHDGYSHDDDVDRRLSGGGDDLTVIVTTSSGVDDGVAFPGITRRIRAGSKMESQQQDEEGHDLVPFDPNTYQFVDLTHHHSSSFIPDVVGSYPRESSSGVPPPQPPPAPDSAMSTDTNSSISDAAIEDILAAAPVLEWVPVLSEDWIKEHHAAYVLSRSAAAEHLHHGHSDSTGPSKIAAGITQYQFEPELNRLIFLYGDEIYLADIPESGKIHPELVVPRYHHSQDSSSDASRSPLSSSLVLQQQPPPSSPSVYFISGASPKQSPESAARMPVSTSVSSIASRAAASTTVEDHMEGGGCSSIGGAPGSGLGSGGSTGAGAGANAHVRMDPKLGGAGMNLIAFTRTRDLWVMTTSGVETQLTFCSRNKSNIAISCGIAEFIMQEEFHRYTNYYWAPPPPVVSPLTGAASSSSSSINSTTSSHHRNVPALPVVTPKGLQTRPKERILYLQVSETMVDVVVIPRQGIHPDVEEYRYPHAGTANAASDIQIVEFVAKQHEDDIVPEPLHKRLWGKSSIYKICPWLEYIVRFGWMPDGESVWAQVLDRRQQMSALIMIPLDCFQSVTEHASGSEQTEEELASRIKILFEEQSDYWINVTDIMYIFPSDNRYSLSKSTAAAEKSNCFSEGESVQCIVASERTGFRHLYLLSYYPASGSSVVPITSGDYQVVDKPISVDLDRRLVYFTAKRDTVLETHLYVASFASGGADSSPHQQHKQQQQAKRLTHIGYSHQVTMDLARDRFLTLYSSIEQSPACAVMHLRWDDCKRKTRYQHHPAGFWQESKRKRLATGGGGSNGARRLHCRWCECGCHLPKISSYALVLREGIHNRSAKDIKENPVVPPSVKQPSTTLPGNTNVDGDTSGRALMVQNGHFSANGAAASASSPNGNGKHYGNNASSNANNNNSSIRPRKSLSGFLASHLLSPGILQGSKFSSSSSSSSDTSLVVDTSSLSSRSRTISAPRLGGAFSLSSTQAASSSSNSSPSGSGSGGGGGSSGSGAASTGGGPTSPTSHHHGGLGAVNANYHPAGEFFTFHSSDNVTLHGCLYRPVNYVRGNKYPTLVSIYGGPKSQMVTNEYKLPKFLRVFLATRMGYAVVMFDGRGSNERGIAFEGRLRHQMGQVEIQDQVEGLQFLARPENGGIVDMDRVAITGWSYGGYLSLMALVQYPEVFKLAIAGAPVTQWELYNSAYTERYMGLLSENKEGYTRSNVLSWIEKFPDSENRLLIAHGLIDENVHFKNTETLSAELIRFNKPHHIQLYPTERHGLRDARVNEHFETLMFYWLRNYL